jgi:AmmeMemoRadiSam system protein B/AmmeMemoRadiSam system protein A
MSKIFILFITLIFLFACSNQKATNDMSKKIRQPAVAGQFYPYEAGAITDDIQRFLNQVGPLSPALSPTPSVVGEREFPLPRGTQRGRDREGVVGDIRAIMVPHAGYDYSGLVAAYGFKLLEGKRVGTVVLIGNSHQAYFAGAAIDDSDAWQTALGQVAVDKELARKLVNADTTIKFDGAPHQSDHNLEVELPFLQTVLASDFKIVPIEFGNKDDGSYKKLARALADNLSENDLVVVSTDMSHYPKYADANKIDQGTLAKIKTGDAAELEKYVAAVESAGYANEQTVLCGLDAVKTVMELARLTGWEAEILKYANSGDVPVIGDKSQVVGYGAVVFGNKELGIRNQGENATSTAAAASSELETVETHRGASRLNDEQQKILLKIARETVESYVKNGKISDFSSGESRLATDERLNQKQGAFVTLNKNGQLRGCVGQIVPSNEPLWRVVRDMAVAACSQDSRFSPVDRSELKDLEYEVSVLSAPAPIDNWKNIELGKHGVIVKRGWSSGVFLPQVATETGWSLEEFLGQLCWQKAGLEPDCYKNKDTQILVFEAQVIK